MLGFHHGHFLIWKFGSVKLKPLRETASIVGLDIPAYDRSFDIMLQETTSLRELFSVQNRTQASSGVEYYVERFKNLRQDSAGSVLDLATTLADAEEKLTKEDFKGFCDRVGVATGKSYHKKLRTIGKNASRLKLHLRLLPHCWTTIYKLAQMDFDKFADFVAAGQLSPKTKATDISRFLCESANGAGAVEPSARMDACQRVIISFRKLDEAAKIRVAAEIFALAKEVSRDSAMQGSSDQLNVAA